MKLDNVQEYCENKPVELIKTDCYYNDKIFRKRLVIKAYNEGGYNSTEVDLLQLLNWLKIHKPSILKGL